MLVVLKTGEIPGFTQTVNLNELDSGQQFPGSTDELRCHGRSAIGQDLKAAQIVLLRIGELGEEINHRRNQHGAGDPMFLDRFTESGRREASQRKLTCADNRRREHRGKVGDMEDRRGVEIDAALLILHPVVEIVNIRQHVHVRQHHALRSAGRAAGVYQCQRRVGIVIGSRRVAGRTVQRLLVNQELPRDSSSRRREGGMPHQPARARVLEHLIDLHDRKARVDRNDNDAEPAARVHQFEVLGTIGKEERQPVASVEPAPRERRRQTHDAVVKLAKRQPAPSAVECGPVGIVPGGSIDGVAIDHVCSRGFLTELGVRDAGEVPLCVEERLPVRAIHPGGID